MADLVELALRSLPLEIRPDKFLSLAAPFDWQEQPKEALLKALQECGELDWQKYLKCYPDLTSAGVDAIQHFVELGIHEGRRLARKNIPPRVSIVVPNFNNALFLDKCVSSLTGQTERNIEIVIVDDCSTDKSREEIAVWLQRDHRVKLVAHSKNLGTHMARKSGVAQATGDIVMFVDSDDFLAPEACEKAADSIAQGFDICHFGLNLIDHGRMSKRKIEWYDKYFNSLEAREYTRTVLLSAAFVKRAAPRNICFGAYRRNIAQKAFAELADGRLLFAEDLYEYLALVNEAQSIIKIADRLYNYSFNVGITSLGDSTKILDNARDRAEILTLVKNYCDGHGLESVYKGIETHLTEATFQSLACLPVEQGPEFFKLILEQYGALGVALRLRKFYDRRWDEISLRLPLTQARPARKIGIFYFRAKGGGIETTMRNMISALRDAGYPVCLFLEEMNEADSGLGVEIFYISPSSGDKDAQARHLSSLHQALKAAAIDLMIHMWVHESPFFWDNLLLHLMDIPVIGSLRFDHNLELLYRGREYQHKSFINTLRTLSKVFCLTQSSEIYLRSQGIDAIYVPNTPRRSETPVPSGRRGRVIGFIGRLHDDKKQILQSQYILQEVLKECPDAKFIYIGGFEQSSKENLFWKRVKRFGLERHVEVTGWTDNPSMYFDKCQLLLYTSFMEGFPNGLAEAQARGLPVVMYNLDIEMAKDNPSIIVVPQYDVKGAAREIIGLLQDHELRDRLASCAIAKADEYGGDRFANELVALIRDYGICGRWEKYAPEAYRTAIKSMAFYAGKKTPAF
ncbi:MAG: glycosyltransferase [Desulfovibrio sp.]|nr:glycosyltransferase [Desulfovibrio sp.]